MGQAGPRKPEEDRVTREVGEKAARKLRARSRKDRGLWYGLGMFGLVGWSVVVPTLIGVGLGIWLDSKFPGRVSWTLTLLIVGVLLGCLNAWYWVKRESRDHDD